MLEIGRTAEPALHAEALAKLAELRLAQGRPEEAARLLADYEDQPATAFAVAAVRPARGEAAVASSILRRRLRELDEGSLEAVAVLDLLVEAEIARGAVPEAATLARRLAEFASAAGCKLIVARGQRTLGRALVATGDVARAIPHLEAALAAFGRLEMPFEAGRTRLLLARALACGDPETAIAEGLFISRKTVERHVASVLSKLGLRGRARGRRLRAAPPRRGANLLHEMGHLTDARAPLACQPGPASTNSEPLRRSEHVRAEQGDRPPLPGGRLRRR